MKVIRNLLCKLGYHQIEGHVGALLGQNEFYNYYLICKNCHYHIANINIKEKYNGSI
ncbi:hypothetical protein LCGC14_1183190 [marine sediment metagenome]|uniref:Uncharacterized protein n=1 Tax=marine sediment metagenome TaxID=412755 RepID=A0A0F9LRD9_9ZZZZ